MKTQTKSAAKALFASLGYDLVRRPNTVKPKIGHNVRSWDKVFCIGANKTGTTSLALALNDLNLRVADQSYQERLLTQAFHAGQYDRLLNFADQWDAFQDQPFASDHHYVACDALFPKAKFILTIRPAQDWFDSLCRFHLSVFGVESVDQLTEDFFKSDGLYLNSRLAYDTMRRNCFHVVDGDLQIQWNRLYDADFRMARYNERNDAIIRHFEGRPDKLLVLDVEKEKTTQRIADFLGLRDREIRPMPHENKTGLSL